MAIERALHWISQGCTETDAALRVGVTPKTWQRLKAQDYENLKHRIAEARIAAGELKYQKLVKERQELKDMKLAARKPSKSYKKLLPRKVRLVYWYLNTQVPLSQCYISKEDIRAACKRYDLSRDEWEAYDFKHALLSRAYQKRADIRAGGAKDNKPREVRRPDDAAGTSRPFAVPAVHVNSEKSIYD